MHKFLTSSAMATTALLLVACATVEAQPERVVVESVVSQPAISEALPEAPVLKRRIALARFSNSTNYGKGLLFDGENDPLANQASDMLVQRLIETGMFLVFERSNLDELSFEQSLLGGNSISNLVGVDAVIIGSITQFGRSTEGQSGFLSSTKKQTVNATVDARLVNPRTGLAFFSASGQGEASTESGEVAGFGSRAAYDASLNDKAIAAAVSNITSEIVGNLSDRPWSTDVLEIEGNRIFISGGSRQGIKIGDIFSVETIGRTVQSGQSGLPITLPGEKIAEIRVDSFFGDSEYAEGSTTTIVQGAINLTDPTKLIVKEAD